MILHIFYSIENALSLYVVHSFEHEHTAGSWKVYGLLYNCWGRAPLIWYMGKGTTRMMVILHDIYLLPIAYSHCKGSSRIYKYMNICITTIRVVLARQVTNAPWCFQLLPSFATGRWWSSARDASMMFQSINPNLGAMEQDLHVDRRISHFWMRPNQKVKCACMFDVGAHWCALWLIESLLSA